MRSVGLVGPARGDQALIGSPIEAHGPTKDDGRCAVSPPFYWFDVPAPLQQP